MQTRLLPRALLGLLLATTANAPVIADYAHHPKTPLLLKTLHDDYGFSAEDLDVVKAELDDA